MKKVVTWIWVLIIVLYGAIVESSTYYVDATGGNDINSGISTDAAWQTIGKVNGSTFQPGDSILFKKGEIWREKLIVASSGNSANPITFGSYGTGLKPKITSTQIVNGNPTAYDVYKDYLDKNADFENWSSGMPSGWSKGVGGTSDVTQEPTIVHHGGSSVKLHKDGTNLMLLYRGMSHQQGMRYIVKFWAKGASGGEQVGIMLRSYEGGISQCQPSTDADGFHNTWSSAYQQVQTYTLSAEWAEYTLEFQTPTSWPSLQFWVNSADATVYLDDMRCYPAWTPHPSTPNVFGIHWRGNDANEFLRNSTMRLNRVGWDQVSSLLDHEYSFSSNPWNVYWYRDDFGSPTTTGTLLEMAADPVSVDTNGKNYLVFDGLEVYGSRGDYPNTSQTFWVHNSDHVIVSNSTVYLASNFALSADNSTNVTFSDNEVFFAGSWGINAGISRDIAISRNNAHDCGNAKQDLNDGHGIGIASGSSDVVVELNDLHDNGYSGGDGVGDMRAALVTYNASNVIVRKNHIHDNYRGGIDIAAGAGGSSSGCEVYYNVVVNNGRGEQTGSDSHHSGICIRTNNPTTTASNHRVYNNTIYHNDFTNGETLQGAIKLLAGNSSSISNVVIENNISSDNIGGYELSKVIWNGGSISAVLDYNLYYRPGGGNIVSWDGVKTWDTYHTSEGNEPQSLNVDPLFVDTVNDNLALTAGSPAKDTGLDLGTTYADGLVPNVQWTTGVTTLNQNEHGLEWERGAYVYP